MLSEPLLHREAPKQRGRPPKVATKLIRHARALSHEHFAFVRATLLGLDLRKSFERYIAWSEPLSDLRIAQSRFEQFLGQILDSGAKIDATLPEGQKITALLGSLRQAQRAQRKSQRALNLSPTLNPGPGLHHGVPKDKATISVSSVPLAKPKPRARHIRASATWGALRK